MFLYNLFYKWFYWSRKIKNVSVVSHQVGDKSKPNGGMTLGFMPSLHQVAALVQRGTMTVQTTSEVSGRNRLSKAD